MNFFRYSLNVTHLGLANTVSHMYGTRPYDGSIAARENLYMNAWTFGEGYHNFHHVFPQDYRGSEFGGVEHWNINTLLIRIFELFGWAYDLKTTSPEMIARRIKRTGDGTHYTANQEELF